MRAMIRFVGNINPRILRRLGVRRIRVCQQRGEIKIRRQPSHPRATSLRRHMNDETRIRMHN